MSRSTVGKKGPKRPPDTRPWKQPQGLGQLMPGDLVAIRWHDHWKIADSWKLRGAALDCVLPSGSVLTINSARQVLVLKGEIAKNWKVSE